MMTKVLPKEQAQSYDNDDVVLSVQGVSKKFCRSLKKSLFYGVQDIFGELLGVRDSSDTLRPQEFWALKDISFELRRGEALGLVGANGAGKTTLLRIISGLIKPDHGTVDIKGRIAPLIALGAGFNPILTGRENIYTNMSILGLSKQEIDYRFQEVVDFAEIGEAIDAPVQSYSSGMRARLGFASAIHTNPDILLIDEVLAVGDTNFRSKCFRSLAQLQTKGVSFVMVSHNAESIYVTCTDAIYLSKGQIISLGSVDSVMGKYERDLCYQSRCKEENKVHLKQADIKYQPSIARIDSVEFKDKNEMKIISPTSGQPTYLCFLCDSRTVIQKICFRLRFQKQGYSEDFLFISSLHDDTTISFQEGLNEVKLYFPYLGLMPGLYNLIAILNADKYSELDVIRSFKFRVQPQTAQKNLERSKFYQPRFWINPTTNINNN